MTDTDNAPHYQIRQCQAEACRLRFPIKTTQFFGDSCPNCGAPTNIVAVMPVSQPIPRNTQQTDRHLPHIEVLLDNLRSVYNVGSIFRTADGAGVRQIHLCGISPTPKHPKLAKTALGAAEVIPWTQELNGLQKALALKEKGYHLWALEDNPNATSLFDATIPPDHPPIVLIFGNEVIGVDPGILAQCHNILHIPMVGHKESLNVAVAFGIAVYYLLHVP